MYFTRVLAFHPGNELTRGRIGPNRPSRQSPRQFFGNRVRISTYKSLSGVKSLFLISNWVAPIFLTPVPQKLTRFDASPLSITSRKSLIGPDQLAPVLRIYSIRASL